MMAQSESPSPGGGRALLYWLIVGIPLTWGVAQSVNAALPLFGGKATYIPWVLGTAPATPAAGPKPAAASTPTAAPTATVASTPVPTPLPEAIAAPAATPSPTATPLPTAEASPFATPQPSATVGPVETPVAKP